MRVCVSACACVCVCVALCSTIAEANVISTRCVASVVHEGWSFSTGRNDIALCFLQTPVTSVKPVSLARGT